MAIRNTYSKAFKIEAVRLLGLGEKPASQSAQGHRHSCRCPWAAP